MTRTLIASALLCASLSAYATPPDGYYEVSRNQSSSEIAYFSAASVSMRDDAARPGHKLAMFDVYFEVAGSSAWFDKTAVDCREPGLTFQIVVDNGQLRHDNGHVFATGTRGFKQWETVCGFIDYLRSSAEVPESAKAALRY